MLCAIKQPANSKIFKHVSESILVECYIQNTYECLLSKYLYIYLIILLFIQVINWKF